MVRAEAQALDEYSRGDFAAARSGFLAAAEAGHADDGLQQARSVGDPSVLYILTGAVAIWAAGATAVTFAERPAFLKAIAAIPIAAALICMAALGRLPYMEHRFLIDAGMLGRRSSRP